VITQKLKLEGIPQNQKNTMTPPQQWMIIAQIHAHACNCSTENTINDSSFHVETGVYVDSSIWLSSWIL